MQIRYQCIREIFINDIDKTKYLNIEKKEGYVHGFYLLVFKSNKVRVQLITFKSSLKTELDDIKNKIFTTH